MGKCYSSTTCIYHTCAQGKYYNNRRTARMYSASLLMTVFVNVEDTMKHQKDVDRLGTCSMGGSRVGGGGQGVRTPPPLELPDY